MTTSTDSEMPLPEGEGYPGKLRIYLGAAPGVGKTYAMLQEGHDCLAHGRDIVIGFVEPHGRRLTEELATGLEVVPPRVIEYRGATFEELDLDAVLARAPEVALVDELAHTNAPGSGRHEKRWQDVLALLEAGIDVVTTVNVQHLESIADAVEQMTGVAVRERVPDWVVRRAEQIELIDSSPEQLRQRLIRGSIYPADRVPQALSHFFRVENLVALRELALRFVADASEQDLLDFLHSTQAPGLWETSERILVAVKASPGTDAIIRRAARIATRTKGTLQVVHVAGGETDNKSAVLLSRLHDLARDIGAPWHELHGERPAAEIMAFAEREQITQIVLGSSQRSRIQEFFGGGSVVRQVHRAAGAAGIDVHTIARREVTLSDAGTEYANES